MKTLRNIFRSVFRLTPSFLLASTIGCLTGHFVFKIPHGELGVVVSIPLVVGFLVTRLLVLLVPDPRAEEVPAPKPIRFLAAFMIFVAGATAAVMLPSAAIYAVLGFGSLAHGAFLLGTCAIGGGMVLWIADVVVTIASSLSLVSVSSFFTGRATELFWDVLRAPTKISVMVFGRFGDPMSN